MNDYTSLEVFFEAFGCLDKYATLLDTEDFKTIRHAIGLGLRSFETNPDVKEIEELPY